MNLLRASKADEETHVTAPIPSTANQEPVLHWVNEGDKLQSGLHWFIISVVVATGTNLLNEYVDTRASLHPANVADKIFRREVENVVGN